MPIYTDKLPQVISESHIVTLAELIRVLPETLDYPLDVWLSDRMAKYGQTSDYIVLFFSLEIEISEELKEYFNRIVKPLDIPLHLAQPTRNVASVAAMKLYNAGRLIIDKTSLTYKELPSPVFRPPILTINELKERLPSTIEWTQTIWLTGGLVRNGWSGKDVDFIVFNETDTKVLDAIRVFFTKTLGFSADVGSEVLTNMEPVYLFKLYENGRLCSLS